MQRLIGESEHRGINIYFSHQTVAFIKLRTLPCELVGKCGTRKVTHNITKLVFLVGHLEEDHNEVMDPTRKLQLTFLPNLPRAWMICSSSRDICGCLLIPKTSMASLIDGHVSSQAAERAASALGSYISKVRDQANEDELLGAKEDFVWLVVSVKRMSPEKNMKPHRMSVYYVCQVPCAYILDAP